MTSRCLCVLNAGSSSLKFALYRVAAADASPNTAPNGTLIRTLSGEVERIGGAGRLLIAPTDRTAPRQVPVAAHDHAEALAALAAVPDGPLTAPGLAGFGHRVVHGGPALTAPMRVDAATLARIDAVSPLAPLHNPPAVAVLKTIATRFPALPQVACFDTAFHRTHPDVADRFAIPDTLYQEGVRRYGFHGLSYEYIAGALATHYPAVAAGRVVVAHLGSGASMCALANGRSADSTMGFTALDGLPMGTRPGSLDPGIILWLQQQKGWTVDRVEHFLYEDCGLKGLSGVSNDMRTLLASEAPLARLDRDTASARGAVQTVLDRVHSGEARILVGTQMLTKGHHFPEVSLVVILDADQGLFASDFRATERLAQTITQVAGRAGREARAGEVLIQTEFPEHPLLNRLLTEGYEGFAVGALEERREAGWPPFSRLAMLRAEAKDGAGLDTFLRAAGQSAESLNETAVKVLGPAPALIARRADHFRAHVLIETAARSTLQRFLKNWLPQVERLPGPPGLRWSIDIDPLEVD